MFDLDICVINSVFVLFVVVCVICMVCGLCICVLCVLCTWAFVGIFALGP